MKNGTKLFPMSTSVSAVFYIQLNRAKAMLRGLVKENRISEASF